MSLTDRPELRFSRFDHDRSEHPHDDNGHHDDQNFLATLLRSDDLVIDITNDRVDLLPAPARPAEDTETLERGDGGSTTEGADDRAVGADDDVRTARAPKVVGMRLRRVRLRSVFAVACLFFVVAYLSLLGTGVALWNLAQRLGLVTDTENLVTTSLGLESFDVAGSQLFDLLTVGAGVLCLLGLIGTMLVAVVYNVAGMLFGGLAFETSPLPRRYGVVGRVRRLLRRR